MAKVLADEDVVVQPWRAWLQMVGIGAGIGLIFWLLTILLGRYVIEPIVCRQLADAAQCVDSTAIAGNVANILASLIGLFILTYRRVIRPLIPVVATAALLWGLAGWTQGLMQLEIVAWSIALYGISYGLFTWIARYGRLGVVIAVSLVIAVIIRIAVLL